MAGMASVDASIALKFADICIAIPAILSAVPKIFPAVATIFSMVTHILAPVPAIFPAVPNIFPAVPSVFTTVTPVLAPVPAVFAAIKPSICVSTLIAIQLAIMIAIKAFEIRFSENCFFICIDGAVAVGVDALPERHTRLQFGALIFSQNRIGI
jgi:hypothetical protein